MLYSHLRQAPIGKRARLVAGIVLLLSMVARSHAAGSLPDLTIPDGFGVNIHFTGAPQDLDLIRDGGFQVIRMDFSWSRIERQKGIYDFETAGYDALTAGCLQRGLRIIYILDYSNRLYEPEQSVRTEAGRQAFAAFAEAAAQRYSGKGILWEFWNEPNIKQFWVPQPDVENYGKLVAEAAPLVRKADPSGVLLAVRSIEVEHLRQSPVFAHRRLTGRWEESPINEALVRLTVGTYDSPAMQAARTGRCCGPPARRIRSVTV